MHRDKLILINTEIKPTPNFKAIVTAHGKTRAYLHRFKIIESSECTCDGGTQTVDHLIYDCPILQTEGERQTHKRSFKTIKLDGEKKSDLLNKYIKYFLQYTNSIDFEKL